jgi:coenzyme F420-0:L-glutamate ligase/coenzyme F420-1:gamma-L-glutamate ligase
LPNSRIILQAIPSLPMVQQGDDLAGLIADALARNHIGLENGDILVISSKIVSKAEGRFVDLSTVIPSEQAATLAGEIHKDPRLVELVLRESRAVSRTAPNVLIVQHRLGFTSANAGIDHSNVGFDLGDTVLLLPEDPDRSATELRSALEAKHQVMLGVIISDTHGRPFRMGNLNVAIGAAGVPALVDQRGQTDLFGRTLVATITPLIDELATAAGLISGQADEGQPVVLIRGVQWKPDDSTAMMLVRPP